MKFTYIILVLLNTFVVGAQSINQFDAHGKRHGIWKKNFDNTETLRYQGEFIHGKEIGMFKFYKNVNNKAVLTASKTFNSGNNIADVIFYTSKGGVISEGQMDGKLFLGTWKYYQKNSKDLLILEHYNGLGKLDGERLVYYKNGQIAEVQHYKNGKLEGASVWYSENGIALKTFIYVNDELHGVSKYYNHKGELITEGYYKNGKKDGVWKYFENGKLTQEKDFNYNSKIAFKKSGKKE